MKTPRSDRGLLISSGRNAAWTATSRLAAVVAVVSACRQQAPSVPRRRLRVPEVSRSARLIAFVKVGRAAAAVGQGAAFAEDLQQQIEHRGVRPSRSRRAAPPRNGCERTAEVSRPVVGRAAEQALPPPMDRCVLRSCRGEPSLSAAPNRFAGDRAREARSCPRRSDRRTGRLASGLSAGWSRAFATQIASRDAP